MTDSNAKKFKLTVSMNDWRDKTIHSVNDCDTGENVFWAIDLWETPEDCTLSRDLFGAYDWLEVVNYGIELGRQGYTKAEMFEVVDDDR